MDQNFIDANKLVDQYSILELAQTAEDYFANLKDTSYHIVKPFGNPDEVPSLLGNFGAVVSAMALWKGAKVLDFGAGSCWSSRFLAQMGCSVWATDVSKSALDIGRELFERLPLIPPHGSLEFLLFDGFNISLESEVVDRIICSDAFHHVINQQEIMNEFFRVLKPGGIVVLSEPGPHHSLSDQSQFEMRNFVVVEQNIVVSEIVDRARAAGFDDVKVGAFSPLPLFVNANEFEEVLAQDSELLASSIRGYMSNHRLFRIHKPGEEENDSRRRGQLEAKITCEIVGSVLVTRLFNSGQSAWLPSGNTPGAVNLGFHLIDDDGRCVDFDFMRFEISKAITFPGEEIEVRFPIPQLPSGFTRVDVDLVAEEVAWFSWDTTTVKPLVILPE
jgi:ubiquinone/menaquinone biosynthesis C-methylase UbiE